MSLSTAKILDAKFLNDVADEMKRARRKFPDGKRLFTALAEEFGEVANALLERGYQNSSVEFSTKNNELDMHVWDECVQTAAMALRLAVEGDRSYRYTPPQYPMFAKLGK